MFYTSKFNPQMEFTTRLERNHYDKHLSQSYTNSKSGDNTEELSPTYSMYTTHIGDAGVVSFDQGLLLVEEDKEAYSVVHVNNSSSNTSMAQIMGMEYISAWLELAFSDDSDDEDDVADEGGLSEPN